MSVTADLQSQITPCQFGGNPDCAQCGCMASAGLKAVGEYRLLGLVPLKSVYNASDRLGRTVNTIRGWMEPSQARPPSDNGSRRIPGET